LATMYHFPMIETYSAKVKKIESKKSKAPESLPVGIGLPIEESSPKESVDTKEPEIDYDNDYFEERFAKDKTGKTDKLRKLEVLKKIGKDKETVAELKDKLIPAAPSAPRRAVETPAEIDDFMAGLSKDATVNPKKEPAEKPQSGPPANLPFAE
jgi:hypothetical protein